jgi:regulator of protease activity HflC (stomatin/prohibitin superfamily)
MEIYYYYAVAAVLIGLVIAMGLFRSVTVYEYEGALMYRKGRFVGILGPGRHTYLSVFSEVRKVDLRPAYLTVAGQEVLTADSISIKASVVARYEIADPVRAINEVQSYYEALYTELQLALREIVGNATIEEVLGGRSGFAERLFQMVAGSAEEVGLKLISADVKDVMFPGALKLTFAQVAVARQEGLAALERARGEAAALRSLANAGQMLDKSPGLVQLRLFQTLAETSGNTLILNLSQENVPMNILPKGGKSIT